MVNVYLRRKKKFAFVYSRRQGLGKQAYDKGGHNNGSFPPVSILLDTGKPLENSKVEFTENETVTTYRQEYNIVLISGGSGLDEDVLCKDQSSYGIGLISNDSLLSVIKQLPATPCLQRRPRSARKSTSLGSRRKMVEFTAFDNNSNQIALHSGASTLVSYEISPKTPINTDKISKFTHRSLICDPRGLLSTTSIEYRKDKASSLNLEELSGSEGNKRHYTKGRRTNRKHFSDLLHNIQGPNFPKGIRSTRSRRPSMTVVSKVNQVSRRLIFSDDDSHTSSPAHKKRGVDMKSFHPLPPKKSSNITLADSCCSMIEYFSQKSKLSQTGICKINAKLSRKYILYSTISSVKGLLATGLLENILVKCKKNENLKCVKDLGINCNCSSCHYSKVLWSTLEKLDGALNMNLKNLIFTYGKIALNLLIKELGKVPFRLLPGELTEVIGCQQNLKSFLACKEPFDEDKINLHSTICEDDKNQLGHILLQRSFTTDSRLTASAPENNMPWQLKKTMKSRDDFHQQVFDLLNDGSKLSYCSHGKDILQGLKFGKNILCSCCNSMLSASKFEAHAGYKKKRKPYHSIYTYGKSLHQIATLFLLDKDSFDPRYRDLIVTCKIGREPSPFLRGQNVNDAGEQRSRSCWPSSTQLRRVFQSPCNSGRCMICGGEDATLNFGNICDNTVLFCGQCGKMFHVGCLRLHGICDVKERPSLVDNWLCGDRCEKVRADLLEVVQGGPLKISKSLLNSLHCSIGGVLCAETKIDWQLLSGRFQGDESKSLLRQATTIFRDEFGLVYKGRRDVLSTMVNGEKGVAEFFGGMFCAVLTIKSVVVSAALLRVFGNHVAELPLVATPKEKQGKGFFKILFLKIEEMLRFMKVDNLILPADDCSLPIWVNKFDFANLSTEEIQQYERKHRIVMFEGTTMLMKAML